MMLIDMNSSLSSTHTPTVSVSSSDSPPTHCNLIIESFSLLKEYMGHSGEPKDAYKSEEFKAGGYKWKLVIYPKGNKKKMVNDHISVYLQIAGANSFEMGLQVYVDFRLFLLDQNRNVYTVFEDAYTKTNCINETQLEVGFDKLVGLNEFNAQSNGYVVDDKCVWGAEVFVCKETRGDLKEYVSRLKSPTTYRHVWMVKNFSSMTELYYTSDPFIHEGQKWTIKLYPFGENLRNSRTSAKRRISVYLILVDGKPTPPATKVFTDLSINILHPKCNRSDPGKCCYTSEWAYGRHWTFEQLDDRAKILDFKDFSIEVILTINGFTKRPGHSEKTKTTQDVDRNKNQPCHNKIISSVFFAAMFGLMFLIPKNKAS